MDEIEKYSIQYNIWEVLRVKLPMKIECPAVFYNANTQNIMIFGGYSMEYGSVSSVYSFNLNSNEIREERNKLKCPGYSVYQPLQLGQNVHLFFEGEDEYPPEHLIYSLINN